MVSEKCKPKKNKPKRVVGVLL